LVPAVHIYDHTELQCLKNEEFGVESPWFIQVYLIEILYHNNIMHVTAVLTAHSEWLGMDIQ